MNSLFLSTSQHQSSHKSRMSFSKSFRKLVFVFLSWLTVCFVVFLFHKSTSKSSDLPTKVKSLEEAEIIVIPVAIGTEADEEEMSKLTPWKEDIIPFNKTVSPSVVVEKILDNALRGNGWILCVSNSSNVV